MVMLYDRPTKMSQSQLERAWLACWYEGPWHCQKLGFYNLKSTDFKNPRIFNLAIWLNDLVWSEEESARIHSLILKIYEKFCDLDLNMSDLEQVLEKGEAMPAFYRIYSQEIMKRKELEDVA